MLKFGNHEFLCDPMSIITAVAAPLVSNVVGGIFGSDAGTAAGGLVGGAVAGKQGQQAQQMVDPFAPYRPQYAQQLNALMANPASVQNLPGYQAQLNQGLQAVQRRAAATGQRVSGNEMLALQDYASGQQNQYFQQQLGNLAMLSGAAVSPAMGGQAGIGAAQQAAGTQSANLGGLSGAFGNVLSGFFGGGQPTAMNTMVDPGLPYAAAGSSFGVGGGFDVTMPNFGFGF